jgi:hypothetical protein
MHVVTAVSAAVWAARCAAVGAGRLATAGRVAAIWDLQAAWAAVCVAAGIFASAAETVWKVVSPAGTETPCWPRQVTAAVRAAVVAGEPAGVVLAALVDDAVVDEFDDEPHAVSARQDAAIVRLRR